MATNLTEIFDLIWTEMSILELEMIKAECEEALWEMKGGDCDPEE